MVSRLDMRIQEIVEAKLARDLGQGGWLRERIRKHVRWIVQGFEPNYDLKEREAFTASVADRIYAKARRRLTIFGIPLWLIRERREWCEEEAEEMVTRFLESERIKFGDDRYCWDDGSDIADDEMSYWEAT